MCAWQSPQLGGLNLGLLVADVVSFLFLRGWTMGSKNGTLVRGCELVEVHFSNVASLSRCSLFVAQIDT